MSMKKKKLKAVFKKWILPVLIIAALAFMLWRGFITPQDLGLDLPSSPSQTEAAPQTEPPAPAHPAPDGAAPLLSEDGRYTAPEDVGLYIHTFGHLPDNYLTKSQAGELGWVSSQGNLWEVTDQMSIGGDRFGNREGLLPKAEGRSWYECDVNYSGGFRGAERILYSSDGLVYYTDDHYESFTRLY